MRPVAADRQKKNVGSWGKRDGRFRTRAKNMESKKDAQELLPTGEHGVSRDSREEGVGVEKKRRAKLGGTSYDGCGRVSYHQATDRPKKSDDCEGDLVPCQLM